MNPELRELMARSSYCQDSMRAVAALLPAEDAALDALLAETVETGEEREFEFVALAALWANRTVDARHLRKGAARVPLFESLGTIAWHAAGDVAEHLLAGVRENRLRPDCEAMALLVIAGWCREHRDGQLPTNFVVTARSFARKKDSDQGSAKYLMALGGIVEDAGLCQVLAEQCLKPGLTFLGEVKEEARQIAEQVLDVLRKPVKEVIRSDVDRSVIASGQTVRRAVARVGRNEPCPCGSGRKYKHCCHAKDVERLHHSSHVAGLTQEEIKVDPEQHSTDESLPRTPVSELVRYDPHKIPPGVRMMYFAALVTHRQFDRAAAALEELGSPQDLMDWRSTMVWEATKLGNRAAIERLMRVPPAWTDDDIHYATALWVAQDDPAKSLKFLMECTNESLTDDDPGGLEGYATSLLLSPLRALGIFVARGLVPILPREHAARVVELVLQARDHLNLPPEDPCADIFDLRFLESKGDTRKDAAALREAQARLGAKLHEVQELKESLARMQKDLARREKQTPAAPVAQPAPATDGRATQELRQKMEGLKSALKARHQERNDLRRELEKAHEDLEALRQAASSSPGHNEDEAPEDREEDWLLPAEPTVNQPLRVIEFPRQFLESLASLPKSVGRGTMTMLGRLAAGEPAAFVGAVKLKACPSVMRQRIGIDFRLLFRLLPDRVQVVDLIPRQDLERKIKTLV